MYLIVRYYLQEFDSIVFIKATSSNEEIVNGFEALLLFLSNWRFISNQQKHRKQENKVYYPFINKTILTGHSNNYMQ